MRGEDATVARPMYCTYGSPPHARGRPETRKLITYLDRITPACAGKTPSFSTYLQKGTDHPRMRGEDAGQ